MPYAVVDDWQGPLLEESFQAHSDCEISRLVLADPLSFNRTIEQTVQDMRNIGLPWLDTYVGLEGFYKLCLAFRAGALRASARPNGHRYEMAAYAAILLERPLAEVEEWLLLAIAAPQKKVQAYAKIGIAWDISEYENESIARCKEMRIALQENRALEIVMRYGRDTRARLGL
jgi:hypothetical protein